MASDVKPVRLGIVGAGVIGRVHLERMAAQEGAVLVGLVDPSPAATELARTFATTHYSSIAALMSEGRPDGVVVATPTELHVQPVLELLDAGAHVLVEKPIAASVEEAQQIIERAEARGRKVLVGHHRRYNPVLERAREIVTSGELGKLVAINANWTLKKPADYFAADWRKRRAAGPILTNLIHEIDTLRHICGEIVSVSAEIANTVRGFEKEDAAAIVFRFASGALCTMLVSDGAASPWAWEMATGESPRFPPARQNTHRFCGTDASLEFPNLAIWRHGDVGEGWHDRMQRMEIGFDQADAYSRQCAHFCAVLRGEAEPRIPADDGTRTLAAVMAVFEAAESGRRVEL